MKKYVYEKLSLSKDSPKEIFLKFTKEIKYDPLLGTFYNVTTGKTYLNLSKKGYLLSISLRYNNVEYTIKPHRLAWFLETGEFLDSKTQVDHIDQNKANNVFTNLRKCNNQENQFNTCVRGKIPFKGVSENFCKKTKRVLYATCVIVEGKSKEIGKFTSPELAAKFYDSAARYYYKEFANTNFKEELIPPSSLEILRKLKIDRVYGI